MIEPRDLLNAGSSIFASEMSIIFLKFVPGSLVCEASPHHHADAQLLIASAMHTALMRACLCFRQGFAELVHHRMTVKVCSGNVSVSEVESFCAQQQAPPQVCVCSVCVICCKHGARYPVEKESLRQPYCCCCCCCYCCYRFVCASVELLCGFAQEYSKSLAVGYWNKTCRVEEN